MKHVSASQKISLFATVFMVLIIFFSSMQPAAVSSDMSLGVLNWINRFFESFRIESGLTNFILRKCAHFLEYFILGMLLLGTTYTFTKNLLHHIFKPLFFGLLIPVLDETIQLFVEGRAGQVADILLDFSGVIAGILILFCVIFFIHSGKNQKNKKIS